MTKKAWIIFITVCVLLLGSLIILTKQSGVDVSKVDANVIVNSGQGTDHVFGNKNAKVILIEYGDYQCPGCGGAYAKLKSLSATYQDQVAFVFRNLPLTNIHPNALAAATAAEAAAKQGKFWEMHDTLYENQSSWENAGTDQREGFFEQYARQIGLDVNQFKKDETSPDVSGKINFDRALAAKIGATGTPTLVLNGNKIDDGTTTDAVQQNADQLRAKIETAITQTGGTLPTPTPQSSGGNL